MIAVQVNGKRRGEIEIAKDLAEEAVKTKRAGTRSGTARIAGANRPVASLSYPGVSSMLSHGHRVRAAVIFGALPLMGCGFHPLLGTAAQGPGIGDMLSAVYVDPIPKIASVISFAMICSICSMPILAVLMAPPTT